MKMIGRIHSPHCDCNSRYVSARSEKCSKMHGTKRQRDREKRSWKAVSRYGDTP